MGVGATTPESQFHPELLSIPVPKMVPRAGFDPATPTSSGSCSTNLSYLGNGAVLEPSAVGRSSAVA